MGFFSNEEFIRYKKCTQPVYQTPASIQQMLDIAVEALGSFTEKTKEYFIPVEIPDELLEKVPADHRAALKKVLEQDPRPSYQNSEERVYGLSFAGMEIKFQVKDEVLHVVGVEM